MLPFLESITPVNLLVAYALASATWGISLLGRFLKHQPITRHRLMHTAWNVAIMGLAIALGNAINTAHERGMVSLLAFVIALSIWFALFAGGSSLLERWFPEEEPGTRPPAT